MLNQRDALIAAQELIRGPRSAESARLERIAGALGLKDSADILSTPAWLGTRVKGTALSVQVPDSAPPLMREIARKSETNYLPLLVKTFAQVIKAEGYYSASDDGARSPWFWWQRNRMDSRQTGLTRSILAYGTSYASALPAVDGVGSPGVRISTYSPRRMTAAYADVDDEWPVLALVAQDDRRWTLMDETHAYYFGLEPTSGRSYGTMVFIEAREHGLGVVPVVRYQDRHLLAGEQMTMGVIEPLMVIQERINETTFQMMVAQYFAAFRQRYVLGWVPEEEGQRLRAGAAQVWYIDKDPGSVKLGEFEATAIAPYLDSAASAKRDFAAVGQIPAQSLGVDGISNISDATLAGLEAAKNREAGEISTSIGESHEQLLRLCAHIDGNAAAATDFTSEIRWRDFESRSFAQTVDGLVKLATGLGLPAEVALEDVPGMTEQKLARVKDMLRRQRIQQAASAFVAGSA